MRDTNEKLSIKKKILKPILKRKICALLKNPPRWVLDQEAISQNKFMKKPEKLMLFFSILFLGIGVFNIRNNMQDFFYIARFICNKIDIIFISIGTLLFVAFLVLHSLKKNEKDNQHDSFLFKDFLYIDMKFLETFMAQMGKGFISDTKHEKGNSISKIRRIFAGANDQLNATFSSTETEVRKEVRSMQQREEMLNIFLQSKANDGRPLVKEIDRQKNAKEKTKQILQENNIDMQKLCDNTNKRMMVDSIVNKMSSNNKYRQELDDNKYRQKLVIETEQEISGKKIDDEIIMNNIADQILMIILNKKNDPIRLNQILNKIKEQMPKQSAKHQPPSGHVKNEKSDRLDELIIKELDASIAKELENSRIEGEYICFKTHFDFISLKRLEKLTTQELQYLYLYKKTSSLIPDNDRLEEADIRRIRRIQKYIEFLKILFPFDSFLITKHAVILMDEKPLREGNNQIGYKFSNDKVVVGKVSRKIGVREDSAPANKMLDKIQRLTISLLRELEIINYDSDIYLITPIAIYSEKYTRRKSE